MKREKRFTRRLPAVGGALIALALALGGGGCELEVGDTIPNVSCLPGGQNPCQSGFVCATNHQCVVASAAACRPACGGGTRCNPSTLECVSVVDASVGVHGPDASSRSEAGADARGDGMDAGLAETAMSDAANGEMQPPVDSQVTCRDLACTCSGPSSCDSGICGNEDAVTTAVIKANGGNSFCTQPCCTSADCSASTVCFAAGTGGNYCVPPEWIGRVAGLGQGIGGATCKVGSDCRSGLCTSASSGTCADPCCSTPRAVAGDAGATDKGSQCATGAVCRFSTFPGNTNDTHYAAWCSPPGAGMLAPGSPCAIDGVCASDRCGVGFGCEAICRSTNDCANGFACSYSAGPFANKDIAAGCMPAMGTLAEGSTCKNNGDCETNFCDSGKCSDVCFSDSDCIKGWHCRPVKISLSNGGYEDILSCGS
jgi:hypothetical protein